MTAGEAAADATRDEVLELLKATPRPMTYQEVAAALGTTWDEVLPVLNYLADLKRSHVLGLKEGKKGSGDFKLAKKRSKKIAGSGRSHFLYSDWPRQAARHGTLYAMSKLITRLIEGGTVSKRAIRREVRMWFGTSSDPYVDLALKTLMLHGVVEQGQQVNGKTAKFSLTDMDEGDWARAKADILCLSKLAPWALLKGAEL